MSTQTKEKMVNITGNTYPVREKLKALGCRWNAQQKCWMISADKADDARKIVGGQAPLNNPIAVPVDQGPVDIVVVCTKYGRIPVGTKTVPFRRADKQSELGETFWGRNNKVRNRYLVVQESRPFYLSRTTLEDNDDFRTEPGHYRSVQCVAVEPTSEEIAADEAKNAAKLTAENAVKRRSEIQNTVQHSDSHKFEGRDTTGMTQCWGRIAMAGHNVIYSDGKRLVYSTSDYDMGPSSWELVDEALAAEALTLKTAVTSR